MASSRAYLLCALLAASAVSAVFASADSAPVVQMQSRKMLQGAGIPIDASVILLFLSDVEGGASSPCAKMVDRAMEFKGRSINFFVTAYYADDNSDSRVDRLGWKKSDGDKSFRLMDGDYVAKYKAGLAVSEPAPPIYLLKRLIDSTCHLLDVLCVGWLARVVLRSLRRSTAILLCKTVTAGEILGTERELYPQTMLY